MDLCRRELAPAACLAHLYPASVIPSDTAGVRDGGRRIPPHRTLGRTGAKPDGANLVEPIGACAAVSQRHGDDGVVLTGLDERRDFERDAVGAQTKDVAICDLEPASRCGRDARVVVPSDL